VARKLTLQKGILTPAMQRILSERYKVMGLTLVWGDVTADTNRKIKFVEPDKKQVNNYKKIKSKVCRLCKIDRESKLFVLPSGKIGSACSDCLEKPTRLCKICQKEHPIELFNNNKKFTCSDCIKETRKVIDERWNAIRRARNQKVSNFDVKR
jgi:hypothetical protein